MQRITPVIKYLIIANVALFVLTYICARVGLDLTQYLALFYPASKHFLPHQFVTHMFMHGGIMHLFVNMWMLWMFGSTLEQVWGAKRFLVFYFVTGLGAAALHTFVNYLEISNIADAYKAMLNTLTPDAFSEFVHTYFKGNVLPYFDAGINKSVIDGFIQSWDNASNSPMLMAQAEEVARGLIQGKMNIPTVGASGAIYGVLLAFGMMFPNAQLMLLFPPIPIRAKYMVILCGVLELSMGLYNPGSNIAHFAHLGGMIFGFFLIRYWQKKSQRFY